MLRPDETDRAPEAKVPETVRPDETRPAAVERPDPDHDERDPASAPRPHPAPDSDQGFGSFG